MDGFSAPQTPHERERADSLSLESDGSDRVSALSARALTVGVVCVVVTCLVVCYAELVVGKIQIGFLQLPPAVIGMLVLILGVQALLGRFSARLKLKAHELFTVYIMMLLAAMVSSRGILQKLIPLLVVPNYFATPGNGWKDKFGPSIPAWAVPFDPHGAAKQFVTARFFEALRPGERIPWQLWILPLCAWAVFVALLFTAYLCLAVILRRQWVDNEKLSFPLVQLPLEMIKGDDGTRRDGSSGGFLKNVVTWFGFALPAIVFGLNGLHQYSPSIPDINTDIDLNAFFSQPPYNQMGFFHMYLSFAAVGFFYLLPTDLLFSLWFFFLFTRYEDVMAASWGYQPDTMPMYGCKTYQGYQIIGCYVVLAAYMIYTARPHLRRVWQAGMQALGVSRYAAALGVGRWALGKPRSEVSQRLTPNAQCPSVPRRSTLNAQRLDEDEVLPYRVAFWGLGLCVLLLAGWLRLLGMDYGLALFEVLVALFLVALVMARSTSEAGMIMTETSFRPIDLYRMVGDPRNLGAANLTGLAFLDGVWLRDQRGLLLTGFLDSMKFADGVRVRRRSLLGVFVVALLLALGVSGYLHIMLPYQLGAVQMYSYVYQGNPVWAFNDAASQLNHATQPLPFFDTLNFFIGALVTVGIATLRTRVFWFPFHPLGYALSGSWTMMVFWFPCFVAWLFKVLILRYGGMRLYARLRPFFLGMVLGEFTMAILFTLPALYNRFTPTPTFPWP